MGWTTEGSRLDSRQGKEIFLISRRKSGRGVKLITHLHPVLRLRMVSYTSTPPYVFMTWCLINLAQGYGLKPPRTFSTVVGLCAIGLQTQPIPPRGETGNPRDDICIINVVFAKYHFLHVKGKGRFGSLMFSLLRPNNRITWTFSFPVLMFMLGD
jgi:hypothetical protein